MASSFSISKLNTLKLLGFQSGFYWTARIARADVVFSVPCAVFHGRMCGSVALLWEDPLLSISSSDFLSQQSSTEDV